MENELPYKPLSVIDKATREIIRIKDFRFNPEIHEQIEDAEVLVKKLVVTDKVTGEKVSMQENRYNPDAHDMKEVDLTEEEKEKYKEDSRRPFMQDLEMTDTESIESELRAKAKELGIKSWHVKNIQKLQEEINQLQNV